MKKIIIITAVSCMLLGCNGKDPIPSKMVEITFDYTLSQSGSMTKAGGVYDMTPSTICLSRAANSYLTRTISRFRRSMAKKSLRYPVFGTRTSL